ncbi:MAG: cadherin domain-containing protein, partial [Planctomycetota bacterium]
QEQVQGDPTPLADVAVYIDANGTGLFEEGEKTTRTNAQGRYWFDYLYPGDYPVRLAVDPGRWDVFPAVREVGVESSEVVDDRNFTLAERLTGTIRGTVLGQPKGEPQEPLAGLTVFLDVIANGVRDLGEPGTVTDAGGGYRFDDLPAAVYTVRLDTSPLLDVAVTRPATWTVNLFDGLDADSRDFLVEFQGDTVQRQGMVLAFSMAGAPVDVGAEAGDVPPVVVLGGSIVQPTGGTIMGSVWLHDPAAQDAGLAPDLVQARGEPGIADQTISLYRVENGVEMLVGTTRSSRADATFDFSDLIPGTYVVRQTPTGKFHQVTGGGVSKPETLYAVTNRDAGKSILWEIGGTPFAATEIGSFTEFVARDLAMFDRSTAFIVGTATDGGAAGLWRYDVSAGRLTDMSLSAEGEIIAIDVLDATRLIGVTKEGVIVTYAPGIDLWQRLGRLQTFVDAEPQPVYAVGDLAVRSAQEVYFVGFAGSPPDLTDTSFPNPARQQAIYRVDTTMVSEGLTLTALRHADIALPQPAKDERLEYLTGLDVTAAGEVFALGSLGGVFSASSFGNGDPLAFAEAGRLFTLPEFVRPADTTFGGLAVVPFEVVPDSARTDFQVTITGRQVVTVGFGNEERLTRLYDGDDFIDGGCDGSADLLVGDDARHVTDDLAGSHLAGVASFLIADDLIIYGGRDTIRGRGGDDRIDGGLQGDVLAGDGGNDVIQGGRGGARPDGTVGAGNWLDGGDGDDTITGGGQADTAYGGAGADTIAGLGGDDELFGGADADTLDGGDGDDLLVVGAGGGKSGQKAIGGAGDDTIVVRDVTLGGEFAVAPTGDKADTFRGDGDTDTLVLDVSALAAGDDLLFASLTNAQLTAYGVDNASGLEVGLFAGGAGDNIFSAATFTGRVVMRGNGGKDVLTGGTGDDVLDAGSGTDNRLAGGQGSDRYLVGAGSTTTVDEFPNAGTDTLDLVPLESAGFDVRVGAAGVGTLVESAKPDVTIQFLNDGIDVVALGDGDNTLTLRDGASTTATFEAGSGSDSIRYTDLADEWAAWAGAVEVDLRAGTATGTAGIVGFDDAIGGAGDDVLFGSDGDNRLDGRGGINTLAGRGGDDTYEFLDLGQTDTVAEIFGQGFDRMLFSSGAAGILFEVSGKIVATFGTSRVTAVSAAGIDLVRGGTAADTFRITDAAAFAGRLEGGGTPGFGFGDLDTLDYSLWTSPVTVDYTPVVTLTTPRAVTGVAGVVDLRHVIGSSRSDTLTGGSHPVWFEGGDGGDTLTGSSQGDKLEGHAGADTIQGEEGADLIRGGTGNDTLVGGPGNDTFGFTNDFGTDSVLEGVADGSDAMDFSGVSVPLTVALGSVTATTAAGDRATHAGSAVERVVGGSGNDRFVMTGPDVVFGGTLDGGGGTNDLRYDNPTREIAAAVAAGGTPNVGAAVRFTSITADSNLFAPVFNGGFTGAVNENAPVTTVVYTARATDADDPPGNRITYSLKTGLVDDAAIVTIDSGKGEVRLKSPANFEAKNAYRFTVIATDAGIPAKATELPVTVNVLNVAEPRTPPRVTPPSGFRFTEDTPAALRFTGTPFTDADSPAGTVMTVTLRIADGSIAAVNGGGVVVGGTPTARSFTGTLANLNAFFTGDPARIVYSPAANASGLRVLGVTIAEGAGAQRLSSAVNVPVTIVAVNDAPVLRAPPGFTVVEDVPGNLVWPAGGPVVTDVDSPVVSVRLSVDAGAIVAA